MTTKEERNTKTAIEYLQHIVDGCGEKGKPSFDKAFALVADDFEIQVMPSTMKMPRMVLPRYRKWIEPLVDDLIATFSMEIVDTTAQGDRVIVEATSSGAAKDGRPYGMEYFLAFRFNETGQIREMIEFVDSLFSARFYGLEDD
jgi:ketosteroid isomerase-like protein